MSARHALAASAKRSPLPLEQERAAVQPSDVLRLELERAPPVGERALRVSGARPSPAQSNEDRVVRPEPDRLEPVTSTASMAILPAGRERAPPGPRAGQSPPPSLRYGPWRSPLSLVRGPQAGKGDVMPTLPAHPNLDQLRHQAKDLLSAAQAGDADAIARILRV